MEGGAREMVAGTLREAAASLGQALRARTLDRAQARRARELLKVAWEWEQDPQAELPRGVQLGREIEALATGGEDPLARRLRRRHGWQGPITVRALEPKRLGLANAQAEVLVDTRQRRREAFLASFGVAEGRQPGIQLRRVAYSSSQDYEEFSVVEKRGRK